MLFPFLSPQFYVVYYNFLTKTLVTELLPYLSLIYFNSCICSEIRRSVKLQQSMRCTQSQKEEIKSTYVVVSQQKRRTILSGFLLPSFSFAMGFTIATMTSLLSSPPLQISVVFLAISCHSVKIIPDLYEAINTLTQTDLQCMPQGRVSAKKAFAPLE